MNGPRVLVDEVLRARVESPDGDVVIARCRAKARGEEYDPAKHGPFPPPVAPGTSRRFLQEAEAAIVADAPERVAELLKAWERREQKQLTLMEGL